MLRGVIFLEEKSKMCQKISHEKDCFDDLIVGFGFGVGRGLSSNLDGIGDG